MVALVRRSALATLTAMALLLIAAPAFAHHNLEHDGGRAKVTAVTVTEDNDNDGMPNTPDPEGDLDNRHPSGKDRSAESGGSGNQGKAESTPDQNGTGPERDYEGTDKPDGAGGLDKLDQDGNNGCGNDDDFEDDNEGLCGGKTKPAKPAEPEKTPPSSDDAATSSSSAQGTSVSPAATTSQTIVRDASAEDGGNDPVGPAGVLSGAVAAPAVAIVDGELAFTGLNVMSLLLVMSILGLLGAAMVLAARRHRKA